MHIYVIINCIGVSPVNVRQNQSAHWLKAYTTNCSYKSKYKSKYIKVIIIIISLFIESITICLSNC